MAHKHAALMAMYAQDAAETDKPWERWERRGSMDSDWYQCPSHPTWNDTVEYRRKPRTITINGHEVPEPYREPLRRNQLYHVPSSAARSFCVRTLWRHEEMDYEYLSRGLVHLTEEAALAHAKALLSFTEVQADA